MSVIGGERSRLDRGNEVGFDSPSPADSGIRTQECAVGGAENVLPAGGFCCFSDGYKCVEVT